MNLKKLVDLHTTENILSRSTIKKYNSVVLIFVRDTGVNSTTIKHETIINWRDDILNRSSAGNWNNYHRHMKALLQTAVKFKIIKTNPFKNVKAVTHYPVKQHLLSNQEVERLFAFCNDIEYGWFWSCVTTTLYYTGIRRRQLVGLTWGDFDLENKQLILRAESSKTKREYSIPMKQQVIDSILIMKHKTKHLHQDENSQIFNITLIKPRYQTNKMNVEHIARFFQKTSKKLNFAVSPHRFRHMFATKLANNPKVDIKTVQKLLGHSSVNTTYAYVHPNMDNMRKAVDFL